MTSRSHPERGAGTVLAVASVATLFVLMGLVHLLSASAVAAAQAARAADLAALAAADAARGLSSGDPCTVAEQVAARNEVTVESCSVAGEFDTEVTVATSKDVFTHVAIAPALIPLPDLPAKGIARAGPPESLQ